MFGKKKDSADGASVTDSTAPTLAPPPPTRNVQPTGFQVSPEGLRRAEERRLKGEQEPKFDYSYMSDEEVAKLRAKGIDPALKAEMDAKAYGKKQGKGSGWKGLWRNFFLGQSFS